MISMTSAKEQSVRDTALLRREVLVGLAALGATALTSAASPAGKSRRRIDVHYHAMVPAWVDVIAPRLPPPFLARARAWTPQVALGEMDRNGIETAVCSVSSPGVWFGEVQQARRLARSCNDYMAAMVRDYPGRFGMFAALPLRDVEGSLIELAYSLDVLKADGIGLVTSYGDKWITDPTFAPVFQELNRRKAVVYVHPTAPSCCQRLLAGMPAVLLEYPIDTSRVILHWIITRSPSTYPDLRMIFSHSGGLLLAGLGRLQVLVQTQPDFKLPSDLAAQIAKLFFEISSSADKATMDLLRSYVPTSQILLGTDSPIGNDMALNLAHFEHLRLSPAERRAIERGNALRLLPRLSKTA